jgi:hypothetical protein
VGEISEGVRGIKIRRDSSTVGTDPGESSHRAKLWNNEISKKERDQWTGFAGGNYKISLTIGS